MVVSAVQRRRDLKITARMGGNLRRDAVGVRQFRIGAMSQQLSNDVHLTVVDREDQCSTSPGIERIDVSVAGDNSSHDREVTGFGRVPKSVLRRGGYRRGGRRHRCWCRLDCGRRRRRGRRRCDLSLGDLRHWGLNGSRSAVGRLRRRRRLRGSLHAMAGNRGNVPRNRRAWRSRRGLPCNSRLGLGLPVRWGGGSRRWRGWR
jgi:hypothetical protein